MAISRSDMNRQFYDEGGIITLDQAKEMAPPGESLAYINPEEAALLKSLGGAGEDINGTGIKSYFLKKVFRKAKKAVKKVVKSPIGKAALLGGLTFGIPGTQFGGLAGKGGLGSFFGSGSFNPLTDKFGYKSGLAKALGKFGLAEGTKLTGLGKIAGIGGLSGLAGLMAAGEQDEDDEIDISKLDRGEGINFADILARARKGDSEFRFLPGAQFTDSYAKGGEVGGRKIMVDRLEVEVMPDESEERAMLDAMMNDVDEVMPEDRKMEFYKLLIPQLRKSGEMSDSEYEGLMGELFGEGKAEGGSPVTDDDLEKVVRDFNKQAELSGQPFMTLKELKKILGDKKGTKYKVGKAEGGIMNLGGNEMDLRGGGFVPLGAKEKADDVPARLSKNEFVMTADAVRAAGGGSVDKGADKMYKMMKQLEAQV